jgi:hypothetical protein
MPFVPLISHDAFYALWRRRSSKMRPELDAAIFKHAFEIGRAGKNTAIDHS